MDVRINGKSVLITGGTGSVGSALVKIFAENGGRVYFQFSSNIKRASELEQSFGVKAIKIDFLSNWHLQNYYFDILINNAGINISKRMTHDIPNGEWEKTIRVNLDAPYYLIHKCLPHMIEAKWGRIVNISSIYGLRASTLNLPYNVSKHGLSALTKTIAKEYASYKITCNEICPGPIESELMNRIAKRKEDETGVSKEEYFRSIKETIPAREFATVTDIANLALFLSSDYAGYINGASIPVDGGLIA